MPDRRLADLCRLSDLADVAIFVLKVGEGEELTFLKLNRCHEQTTGMRSEDIAGKTPSEILPKRMAENVTAKYLTCVRSKQMFQYEEVLELPKGEIWWQTSLSPILFEDGRVIGILGVAIDITDRKTMEIANAALIADLRDVNEKTTTYASMVAHDVRGPLRKIKMIAEMALDPNTARSDGQGGLVLNASQVQLLGLLNDISEKALEHVDTMLSYAHSLNNVENIAEERIEIGLLITDIVTLLDADGTLDISFPSGQLIAEKLVLQLALRNLIANAIHHGRPPCAVSIRPSEGTPGHLEFRVSDSGEGFQDPSVLYEPEKSRAITPTSGFGLAGVRKTVELRGGRLWIEQSSRLSGTELVFTVPGKLLSD